ncbi:uncharacterized protein FSUBG_1287 [Fusarium subglutinans]|uniref:Uncharacterized protein n=1 Tax=Gibberella subglutinans TaxID=42677 RepID=A0A8H5V6C2_GIBSU|nr:uncharacterized protein FSUBG_1287 [Fusarium subglutinans]KAF5612707.1 hypothetical protein FSUBG_1287 [Fusarium subglutinans]
MSDISRLNSRSKRKKSEDHGVMQNLEASSLAILETESTDNVSGPAKTEGNSIGNDSPPTKKKKRTRKPRKVIKDQPRETPCVRCIARMADKGHEHVCFSQASKMASACYDCAQMRSSCELPAGEAVELGQQLQNFALHIVDSQSADERATQVEWLQRAEAAKSSLTAIQETPSVAPNEGSQSVSEELQPTPSGNMPPVGSMQPFSTAPTHSIQPGQHYMAAPQGMSVPGSFAAAQYPRGFQSVPAGGIMNPQGHPFHGISHLGPGPYNNYPQCPFSRLESSLSRVAASVEATHRLVQQILAQGDQNTNAPINFNR